MGLNDMRLGKPPRKNTEYWRVQELAQGGNGGYVWNKRMQKENKDILLDGHLEEKLIDAFNMPKSRVP